ncbi:MAG: site-specific integrase [Candidatus Thiodiazotropha endolucinida]|uniref:Site-specific integrase n=1 Tax=Candidatus Thiodiazotropha taylori TaxID=2792791 RepID=A0A9E4TRF8_9GAMM|nr:site-specific integrase [Candidatus Thiodiazotropha taylori]MCW4235305.1 site-specific integrase [Candidatus Thiodiazotropha endolucinida]
MNIDLRPSTRRMIEASPAENEAIAFIEWLCTERYTDYTIDCHIRRLLFVMPQLWADASPPVLREAELLAVFGRERQPRSRFFVFAGTRRVYTRYLRAQGRLVAAPQPPFEDLIRRYDQYLTEVRGLSVSTRIHHTITLRSLLVHVPRLQRSLQRLSRDDLEHFILERSRQVTRHSLQHEVAHLRAFLRYAYDLGLVSERLDTLDTPRTYRDELPPRALPWPSVLQLLRSIDCTSRSGWRDLCILHLIAYYGLRPSEVVRLRLDSIDWEQALLHVYQSKTRSPLLLPLDARTLRLLQDYLQHGRTDSTSSMLFLRARCPYIPLERTAVGDIFRKRMREAGLPDCAKHVYWLRHTFAMRLLSRGVGMKAIGDVLGHHSFYGTSAYLRLDVAMLRDVALPVPCTEGGSYE